jgi:hypothetical protein
MSGYIGTTPAPQASQTRDVYTATAGQTSFATSGYTPSFLDVYVNGSHLKNGTDYTASNGSDVVMASGLAVGDYVEVVAFTTFSTSDTVSAASGGTFSGPLTVTTSGSGDALTVTSTDAGDSFAPDINFYRNSSSPADNDGTGLINFKGRNDNSQDVTYVQIQTTCPDVSDGSENGFFSINTMVDGSLGDRIVIDANGQVGIGTGSLTRELTVKKNDQCDVSIVAATNQSAQLLFGDTDSDNRGIIQYDNGSDFMAFTVAGSERMRIVGDDLQIGTTSNSYSASATSGLITNGSRLTLNSETGNIYKVFLNDNEQSGHTGDIVGFGKNTTTVGSITVTTSATQYNTSSDYRLKENVVDVTDGITRVKQLAPKRFNFIADANKTVDGFIAHEVSAVVPEAIAGEKDEVDADGNPKWQGIDQSKLVPLLTAALQQAITKIETLETKVAALEAV